MINEEYEEKKWTQVRGQLIKTRVGLILDEGTGEGS
jgi:hypothetical protein